MLMDIIRSAAGIIPFAVLLALAGCGAEPSANVAGAGLAQVAERYVTRSEPESNIDSVAVAPAGGDEPALLIATAKHTDVLRLFDAADGRPLHSLGGSGAQPGQFRRPNGVAVIDDLLVVVERDNKRVQVFSLPAMRSLAILGAEQLKNPYGLWLHRLAADRYRLYVTDNYEMPDESVPPDAGLGERVRTWLLEVDRSVWPAARVTATFERSFGDTEGAGVLRVVESIYGDPRHQRLLIAEEEELPRGRRVKVYTLDGHFTGQTMGEGLFKTQPEGLALYACEDGSGYWISTDQDEQRNVFHLFDRRTLAHVGAFTGAQTRNTDGIWLAQQPLPEFPQGAFFAVHDDQAVAAFDWRDIVSALQLNTCQAGQVSAAAEPAG
jgi:3-phytase